VQLIVQNQRLTSAKMFVSPFQIVIYTFDAPPFPSFWLSPPIYSAPLSQTPSNTSPSVRDCFLQLESPASS